MLKILKYSKTQDFFNKISELDSQENLKVVTPNPNVADLVRNRFALETQSIDAITVSSFIKDEIISLLGDEKLELYYSKSELILWLGGIWKKIGNTNFTSFEKCFRILTELRSFSMSDHVFETVLENYDTETAQSTLWIHRFLEKLEIIDEHKANFLISESLRAGDLPLDYKTERAIVFYGFDFLTASQVDLLKSLALRDDIIIPIYSEVYDQATSSDWIKWFDLHNSEIIEIGEEFALRESLNILSYPKGYLSKTLTEVQAEQDIILATKNLTRNDIQEIPFSDKCFKVSVDIFSSEFKKSIQTIESIIANEYTIEQIKDFLKERIELAVDQENFRLLKCFSLFMNKLDKWIEINEEGISLDEFSLKILESATVLDLPRINLTQLVNEGTRVHDIKKIEAIKNKSVYLVIKQSYGSIEGISASFTERVEKYLASIGPIRRSGFEETNLRMQVEEFMADNNVTILLEQGFLEHSLFWSKFFLNKDLQLQKMPIASLVKNEKKIEIKSHSIKKISASRLQNYIDCPRKYYLNYIEKINSNQDFDDEISSLDLGWVEHKVIELFCNKYDSFNKEKHTQIVDETLKHVIKSKKISAINLSKYFIEVETYTKEAIKKLFELKAFYNFEIEFEKGFDYQDLDIQNQGSLDCICKSSEKVMLLDFKRSNFSFSSYTSILNFDVIQLWFYLKRLKELNISTENKDLIFGYFDLSDLENSMLFTFSKNDVDDLKKSLGFKKVKHVTDLNEKQIQYKGFEEDSIKQLFGDLSFLPNPKFNETCDFCSVKNICNKGVE